jgi:uncharacterized protein YqeY
MTLEERLDADLREAMRSGNAPRKLALRSVKAAITEAKVAGAQQRTLNDADVLSIIIKQVKQRRDSIAEFHKGGRTDLIASEEAEIAVLQAYLPAQLDDSEVRERARSAIAELGVSDLKGIGLVMKRLTGELKGQADGQQINRIVRELLDQVG